MKFGRYMAAAAAASLSVAPAMAAPVNPAASLSLGKSVRAGSSSKHGDSLLGSGVLLAVIIVAGIGTGLGLAISHDSSPSSP